MLLTQRAPAKINLGLHVLRRRPDGYHDIETVFHRIGWADTVTAAPADSLSMTCSDPTLPTDTDNLCLQAAHRLAAAFDVTKGAALHLEKRVPYGAGLGSGSSDAAATLRLLSRLWGLSPSPEQLRDIGRQIGADVPFFLLDAPAAYATARGDTPSALTANGTQYQLPSPLLVAVPPVEISTPDAYAQVTPNARARPDLREIVRSNDMARWRSHLSNDFETPVTETEPAVATLRKALKDTAAVYVSLSGSGSAVYAVFDTLDAAYSAQNTVEALDVRTHLTEPANGPGPSPEC